MGLLSPWFLGGLLAAAIPLYVHLLKQHRSNPVKFSSLMFIERRTQSSVKHRRLKYFALLSLRLAIILLIALMFANPFVRRSNAAAAGGRKFVVVAVDDSFSMRAGDRLTRAKQKALDVIGSMRGGDRGQVIAFSSGVQLLTQPTSDTGELRRAVQGIVPGDGRSAYGEIARTLRAIGNPDGLPVEAHVITDIQRTSMPTPFSELAVAPSMRLEVHAVADRREPNWYVENVSAPASVFQPKKVRVQATVAGAGTEAADIGVELVLNGRTLETRRVALGANGRSTVEFFLPDASYGFNRGEVRIVKGDALPQDDRFPFALERKEASKVLLVYDGRSAPSATYFRAALESVPDAGYTVDAVSSGEAGNLPLDKYAAVVLSDTGANDAALQEYVKRGGGVLIAAGSSLGARGTLPVTGTKVASVRYASREGERFQIVREADSTHPAVARSGKFENVKFYQVASIDAGKGRVVARLSDGSPALVEHKVGGGRVLVFASTLDNVANDLPLHPSFVPFIEQSIHYLSGAEAVAGQYAVDSFVELRSARDAGAAVDVLDPEGKRALSLKEAASAEAFRLSREGFYELRRANGRNQLVAAHADRRESDLDVIPAETLALWQGTGAGSQRGPAAGQEEAKPYSLWWWFALALLVTSIAESLFASRYLTVPEEPVGAARNKAAA